MIGSNNYLVYHFEYDELKNVSLLITYEDVNVPNVTLKEENICLSYYKKRNCPNKVIEKFKSAYKFYVETKCHLYDREKNGRYTFNDRI